MASFIAAVNLSYLLETIKQQAQVQESITKNTKEHLANRPGGYFLYSDDRDDHRIFRGCNRQFSIFWGLFQQIPFKR